MTTQSITHRQNLISRYPVPAFFVIAYVFSWAIGGLLVADHHGAVSVPKALHYVSAFGPAIAALVVTAIIGGRAGLADLWRRIVRVDVGGRWWLIGLGTPVALGFAAVIVYVLSNNALPDLGLFGRSIIWATLVRWRRWRCGLPLMASVRKSAGVVSPLIAWNLADGCGRR